MRHRRRRCDAVQETEECGSLAPGPRLPPASEVVQDETPKASAPEPDSQLRAAGGGAQEPELWAF